MKSIEGIKDEVAIEYGWKSWKSCYGDDGITNTMIDEVAKRYAQSQTQEIIEQNRELVEMLERAKLEFEQFRDAFGQGSLLINEIEKLILKHDKQ